MNRIQLALKQKQTIELKEFSFNTLILSNWIFELPALKKVNVRCCGLKELEPTIFQDLINLEELDLSRNSIGHLDSRIFYSNKHLKLLKLSENDLVELNQGLFTGCSHLERLYLFSNNLTDLSNETFRGLGNLLKLDISFNSLFALAPKLFEDLASLKVLDLRSNRINFLNKDGTQQDANVFKGLVSLSELYLRSNFISVVPEGLFQDLTALRKLDLFKNYIDFYNRDGCGQGPNIFSGLTNLVSLSLRGNVISAIPEGIFENLVALEFLDLRNNKISFSDEGGNLQGEHIFKGLIKVKTLQLRDNLIGFIPEGMFQDLVSLECLHLGNNRIRFFDEKNSFQQDLNILDGLKNFKRLYVE